MEANPIEEPFDLIKINIDEQIRVKLRNNRELLGKLHAFDQHLNMILGNVEECTSYIELDKETLEEIIKVRKRLVPMLFVRGDGIILVSPEFKCRKLYKHFCLMRLLSAFLFREL